MFDINNTTGLNTDKLVDGTEYDYITRTSLNQGILKATGFINQTHLNESRTWSLGLLQMDFFYRNKPWYAGQFVRKIIPKFDLSRGSILFLTTILNKQKKVLLSVLVRDVDEVFKNIKIKLPINSDSEIDFEFMESFVAELEAERVAELEAYLAAASLKDYELTAAELSALSKFENYNWGEFRIGDLFEIKTPKKRFDANKIKFGGLYPYVVRTSINNGIRGYITENTDFLNEKNTISFGQDTATMFYQKSEYFTGDKIKVFKLKDYELNSKIANFLISVMTKAFSNFSWGSSSFNVKILNEVKILLPLNKNGEIDFEFMNNFIKAIEKLVIKDVVLYTDNKIKATKSIVSSNQ
ncbi:restriction endonuclease subunit S [Campylobacter sp.]|uniref:restriction endonuclease subunit S n=1 Tax=Campylobacter sp. TaxID=205 RepID=UPI0025BB5E75|nr:restriction endonuclease subunit S [Campylobacter sp.]